MYDYNVCVYIHDIRITLKGMLMQWNYYQLK